MYRLWRNIVEDDINRFLTQTLGVLTMKYTMSIYVLSENIMYRLIDKAYGTTAILLKMMEQTVKTRNQNF